MLDGWRIELLDVGEFPPEDGATFLENARAKAEFGRSVGPGDEWMLGEDSGLELTALGGRPGVETARWAGGRHVERALEALAGEADRSARYVCELVALSPEGREARGGARSTGRSRLSRVATKASASTPSSSPTVRSDGRGARRRMEGGALAPRTRGESALRSLAASARMIRRRDRHGGRGQLPLSESGSRPEIVRFPG